MSRTLIHGAATAAATLALCAPGVAFAWKHVEPPRCWLPEDMPIQYYVDPVCEDSLPPDYCLEAIKQCWDSWSAVPCVDISAEYAGEYTGDAAGVKHTFQNGDGKNHFVFDDPDSDMEAGVLGVTRCFSSGIAIQLFGVNYAHTTDCDIAFQNNVDFGTQEEIANGQCNGQINFRAVALHEIGHALGLGHSCDEGDPCTDAALKDAIMYWTSSACTTIVEPQEDDIQGITPLYGPSASFSCSNQVSDDLAIGVVPFELKCVVESRDYLQDVDNATWTFGDGGGEQQEGINVVHTYSEPGNYTVQVDVHGFSEGCGEEGWNSNYRKVGFVRACGIPEVEFVVEHVDGLQYQMVNQTDVSVYGCIQDIVWNVYKGDKATGEPIGEMTAKAWEPIFEFPEAGTYTVVGNIGGPAGTGAAQLTFDAKNMRGAGRGCDTVGATGLGASGILIGLGLLGIRRRKA